MLQFETIWRSGGGLIMPDGKRSDDEGFLAHLDEGLRGAVERRARRMHVRKGQVVVGHGADGAEVFCVVEGTFDVTLNSPDGHQVYIRKISAGGMFGEYAALDGEPRSATIVSASDAVLLVIPRGDFVEALKASPEAAIWFARQLTTLIREMTERLYELCALNVRTRLHCELVRLSRAAGVTGNRAIIDDAPTHAELANRIGTHREAVTRELNALAHMNLLSQSKRHLEILDIARLSRMAQKAEGAFEAPVR